MKKNWNKSRRRERFPLFKDYEIFPYLYFKIILSIVYLNNLELKKGYLISTTKNAEELIY